MRNTTKATIVDVQIPHYTIGRFSFETKQCPRAKAAFLAIETTSKQIVEFPFRGKKSERDQRNLMRELLFNGQIMRYNFAA